VRHHAFHQLGVTTVVLPAGRCATMRRAQSCRSSSELLHTTIRLTLVISLIAVALDAILLTKAKGATVASE
jgi:hypothetical protein